MYLWRAIDQNGEIRDILAQAKRNKHAALRVLMLSVVHDTTQYANNRVELSHQPTRQRERQMRGSKSRGQAQLFLAVHGMIGNLFRVGRHILRAANHRLLRSRAFVPWNAATCA